MTEIVPERPKNSNIRGLGRLELMLLVGLIILVGVASFGLGRLSATEGGEGGLIIHEAAETTL